MPKHGPNAGPNPEYRMQNQQFPPDPYLRTTIDPYGGERAWRLAERNFPYAPDKFRATLLHTTAEMRHNKQVATHTVRTGHNLLDQQDTFALLGFPADVVCGIAHGREMFLFVDVRNHIRPHPSDGHYYISPMNYKHGGALIDLGKSGLGLVHPLTYRDETSITPGMRGMPYLEERNGRIKLWDGYRLDMTPGVGSNTLAYDLPAMPPEGFRIAPRWSTPENHDEFVISDMGGGVPTYVFESPQALHARLGEAALQPLPGRHPHRP